MRFKIIKNPAGQFRCQIVASNGEVVWWTENYVDERDAEKAVDMVSGLGIIEEDEDGWPIGIPVEWVDEATGEVKIVSLVAESVSRAKTRAQKVEGAEVEG